MLVYIAGPYTKGNVAENVHNAIKTADALIKLGHIPYIPHLTHFWHLVSPKPWEFWMEYDMEFLSFCDAVLRIGGESVGADREVAAAINAAKPVFFSLEAIGEA